MGNAHNTVFDSKRSAICTQAVYFLHWTRPSVTWLCSCHYRADSAQNLPGPASPR